MWSERAVCLLALICAVFAGCKRSQKFDQAFHENQFASEIAQALQSAERMSGASLSLTNLLILTNHFRKDFLATYESKFLQYGKEAGFTNSLLEKYGVVPPEKRVFDPYFGQILLVGAFPFRKQEGHLGRMCVTRTGSNYGSGWISEEKVQEAFRNVGVALPSPAPMPSMRWLNDPTGDKDVTRLEMKEDLAKFIAEEERRHSKPIWQRSYWQVAGLFVAVVLVVAAIWLIGRRPRN